jgi:hypothetical protein
VVAVFVLRLYGVGEEQAVAAVLLVETAAMLANALVGSVAMWRHGVTVTELRRARAAAAPPGPEFAMFEPGPAGAEFAPLSPPAPQGGSRTPYPFRSLSR